MARMIPRAIARFSVRATRYGYRKLSGATLFELEKHLATSSGPASAGRGLPPPVASAGPRVTVLLLVTVLRKNTLHYFCHILLYKAERGMLKIMRWPWLTDKLGRMRRRRLTRESAARLATRRSLVRMVYHWGHSGIGS